MNKTLISVAIAAVISGGAVKLLTPVPVPLSQTEEVTETIKVIHQKNGMVNIVNKDGLGVLIKDEDMEAWLNSTDRDDKWIEDLRAAAKQVAQSDPLLQNTSEIEAHYEQNITTQPQ